MLALEAEREVLFRNERVVAFGLLGFAGMFEWAIEHPHDLVCRLGDSTVLSWMSMETFTLPGERRPSELDVSEAARLVAARSGRWYFRGRFQDGRPLKPHQGRIVARLTERRNHPLVQFNQHGQSLGSYTLGRLESIGVGEMGLAHGWVLDAGAAAQALRLAQETLIARQRPLVLPEPGPRRRVRLSSLAV